MNPIIQILLYCEGAGLIFGIIRMIVIHRSESKKHREVMAELRRRSERMNKAYELHRYVMKTYGIEYIKNLPSPDEIIEDTKPITVFNYLEL